MGTVSADELRATHHLQACLFSYRGYMGRAWHIFEITYLVFGFVWKNNVFWLWVVWGLPLPVVYVLVRAKLKTCVCPFVCITLNNIMGARRWWAKTKRSK